MTLRVAFYGTGGPALPFLKALKQVPDIQLAAVCDVERHAAAVAALPWQARVYLSYEAMLEETHPDALWVCVEPPLQGDVILKAAELRIPLFIVPPGAVDYEHALAYGAALADAQLLAVSGYLLRLADIFLEAREYLGANQVRLALGWCLAAPKLPASGDAYCMLWNEGCQLVDALRFFCGEVARVRTLQTDDAGGVAAQLEFERGTIGTLTSSLFARPEPRVELEFLGEGWSLLFEQGLTQLRHAEHDKTTLLRPLNNSALEATTAFLDAVADGEAPAALPDYADAVRTLTLCHAIELSGRERRVVNLADLEVIRPEIPR